MTKGQVSIEFISLLSLVLLISSVLTAQVIQKSAGMEERSRLTQAENIAQKTAYRVDYLLSNRNSSVRVVYSNELSENYSVKVRPGRVVVPTNEGNASFPTYYSGNPVNLSTEKDYWLSYSEGSISE